MQNNYYFKITKISMQHLVIVYLLLCLFVCFVFIITKLWLHYNSSLLADFLTVLKVVMLYS